MTGNPFPRQACHGRITDTRLSVFGSRQGLQTAILIHTSAAFGRAVHLRRGDLPCLINWIGWIDHLVGATGWRTEFYSKYWYSNEIV
jgi:hypothetical protein